ncbi:VCBS repeat-containing protein [Pedobacter sp. P351]|uniref:FG-GAP repeat domain-containing protein n=1 Tax=Pedobacter superstes TaxID=3133441 RepID=UPI0030A280A1
MNFNASLISTFLIVLFAGIIPGASAKNTIKSSDANIIIGASLFFDEIPAGHYLTDAETLKVPWLFNNTGLVMSTRSNYVIKINVPESGNWYLFARSQGARNNTFRVAVNDTVIDNDLGNGPLSFKKAGIFHLKKGSADIRLMRIEGAPVMDVLVLSKNPDFKEEDLLKRQYNADVELLKEYKIPVASAVRFGDVTNDGKMDFMVVTHDYATHVYDHDGKELWTYKVEPGGEKDEAPGLIWDIDRDGWQDVIHWQLIDGKEWLVIANGLTGEIKKKTEWPGTKALPHAFNNYRISIAKFNAGYPDNILVFTDIGGLISIAAYDKELKQLWIHNETKKKDHLGHYVYPKDIDKDGIEEIVAGSMLLNSKGIEVWNRFKTFYDNHDHVDAYSFADINKDGNIDLLAAHSEVGVMAIEAKSGKMIWQNMAEHTQRIESGNFLKGVVAPQIAVTARTYGNRAAGEPYLWGQVQWFDSKGKLISKWPGNPITGNPAFVKGNWKGNGKEELFWSKFRMNENGKGEQYFGETVYHMFNFMGYQSEEVITLQNGLLKIYGYKYADRKKTAKPNLNYLREVVVNHTYY